MYSNGLLTRHILRYDKAKVWWSCGLAQNWSFFRSPQMPSRCVWLDSDWQIFERQKWLNECKQNYDQTKTIWLLSVLIQSIAMEIKVWQTVRVIECLNAIQVITHSTTELTKGQDYELWSDWLGKSLLVGDGDRWRRTRKQLTPAFSARRLDVYTNIMDGHARVSERMFKYVCSKEMLIVDINRQNWWSGRRSQWRHHRRSHLHQSVLVGHCWRHHDGRPIEHSIWTFNWICSSSRPIQSSQLSSIL